MAQQRYHVIERIDAGGMAEVFKANASSLQGFEKLVAIKRILPNLTKNERFVRMFLDEAKVSLHLNHTNCVQVFDLGLADGTYFIVMEFVDGVNLKHIIEEANQRGEALPPEQVAYVGVEICKGLAHAHNKRDQKGNHLAIVHRDISPPNILVSREGEVKITDFGLAKAKSQVEQTDPGVVKGKFGYLSPEAAYGEAIDARTDIFAIGILMWEMLAGERLFLGPSDLDTLQLVRKNEVPALSKWRRDVPTELERVVRKALATDLGERYATVEELARDLAAFMYSHGKPVTSFDIASWVNSVVAVQKKRGDRTDRDRAVEAEVQQAVNQIVSLEEVDDLDLYMAQTYGAMEDSNAEYDPDGSFEDPRLWADFGGGEDDALAFRGPQGGEGEGEAWQERNLEDLMRRKKSRGGAGGGGTGLDAPLSDPTLEMSSMDLARQDAMRAQAVQAAKGGTKRRSAAAEQAQTPAPADVTAPMAAAVEEPVEAQAPAAAPGGHPEGGESGGGGARVVFLTLVILAALLAAGYVFLNGAG